MHDHPVWFFVCQNIPKFLFVYRSLTNHTHTHTGTLQCHTNIKLRKHRKHRKHKTQITNYKTAGPGVDKLFCKSNKSLCLSFSKFSVSFCLCYHCLFFFVFFCLIFCKSTMKTQNKTAPISLFCSLISSCLKTQQKKKTVSIVLICDCEKQC